MGRPISYLLAAVLALPALGMATSTPYFDEIAGAVPDQTPVFDAMAAPLFVHIVAADVTHDGLDDLVVHYWAYAFGSNPPAGTPCTNKLVILVLQPDGHFIDQTSTVLDGPADLGACSAEHRVADVNGDGYPDILYPTSQEDGRAASDPTAMFAQATALMSQPNGKYAIEHFGTQNWYHMVGLGYDAQGKVAIGVAGYSGGLSEVWQRATDGTWTNVSAGFPQLNANAFSLFDSAGGTGPSDTLIQNAMYPATYDIGGAFRDAGGWHVVPNLQIFEYVGTLTLITWSNTASSAQVFRLGDLDVTAGTFLDSCQLRMSPQAVPMTVMKLSTKAIPGGYTGPDQVVYESDLTRVTRMLGFRLAAGTLQAADLPIVNEQTNLESRFFDCGDLDGDGFDDLAVYPFDSKGYPLVYINNRHGSLVYVPESTYPYQAMDWGLAGTSLLHDFDHDGTPDLLTWPGAGATSQFGGDKTFHYYRGLAKLPTELIFDATFE